MFLTASVFIVRVLVSRVYSSFFRTTLANLTVAALAIDKVGPRPYHFRSGPTTGPTRKPKKLNQNLH